MSKKEIDPAICLNCTKDKCTGVCEKTGSRSQYMAEYYLRIKDKDRERRRAYHKEWYAKNKDRVRKYQREYKRKPNDSNKTEEA